MESEFLQTKEKGKFDKNISSENSGKTDDSLL